MEIAEPVWRARPVNIEFGENIVTRKRNSVFARRLFDVQYEHAVQR